MEKELSRNYNWRLSKNTLQSIQEVFNGALKNVLEKNREYWIHTLTSQLSPYGGKQSVLEEGSSANEGDGDWLSISSLSQLRKEVGGRFQNLRERWLNSGFPLKAHRGEGTEKYTLNQDGWLEMTSWLLKQGYESRILGDGEEGYFELRKRV